MRQNRKLLEAQFDPGFNKTIYLRENSKEKPVGAVEKLLDVGFDEIEVNSTGLEIRKKDFLLTEDGAARLLELVRNGLPAIKELMVYQTNSINQPSQGE